MLILMSAIRSNTRLSESTENSLRALYCVVSQIERRFFLARRYRQRDIEQGVIRCTEPGRRSLIDRQLNVVTDDEGLDEVLCGG